MAKNQESQRLEGDTTLSVPADLSGAAEASDRPVSTERRFYIVHSRNDEEEGIGLAFDLLDLRAGVRRGRGMLDRAQQAQLGKLLRGIFSDVEDEPVPERFVKLLEALEAQEKAALEAKAQETKADPGAVVPETREKAGA